MLSGYPCELYERALPDWHSLSLQVMNQAGVVTEKLSIPSRPPETSGRSPSGSAMPACNRPSCTWLYLRVDPVDKLDTLATKQPPDLSKGSFDGVHNELLTLLGDFTAQ